MNVFFSRRFAGNGLVIILSLVVVFHLLVVIGIVPHHIVWGGKLTDHSQMLAFEAVSIILNLLMLGVVAVITRIVKLKIRPLFMQVAIWVMFALFLINTVGNLFSENELERMIFTPVTLFLSLLCLRLATSKP